MRSLVLGVLLVGCASPDPGTTPSGTMEVTAGPTGDTGSAQPTPTVLITDVFIDPDVAAVGDELTCSASGSASDGASLAWSTTWLGPDDAVLAEGETLLVSAPLARGDEVRCEVRAVHPEGPEARAEASLVLENAPPTAEGPTVAPELLIQVPSTCSAELADLDGDPVGAHYAWTNLRTGLTVHSEATFAPERWQALPGDLVRCSVQAEDGQGGSVDASVDVEVGNRAPEPVDTVTLTPEVPLAYQPLTCTAGSLLPYLDADFDPLDVRWVWEVDGAVFADATDPDLPAEHTEDGQSWRCGVELDDGVHVVTTWSSTHTIETATLEEGWANLSVGWSHNCGVKPDGSLWCWGDNTLGQLGDGTLDHASQPVQEASLSQDWLQVSAGVRHTCALKVDGSAHCWGYGLGLGVGDLVDRQVPTPVQGGMSWATVHAFSNHSCGIDDVGALYCWGDGGQGQVGDGSYVLEALAPVQEATGASWLAVDGSFRYTCGIRDDRTLHCWGYNSDGQLGDGTTVRSPIPVQEATGRTDWAGVAAGRGTACAHTEGGATFCWGAGSYGALGNGEEDQLVPEEVFGGHTFEALSYTEHHVLALDPDQQLWGWGLGLHGELGPERPRDPDNLIPQEGFDGWTWEVVGAGNGHSCGIDTDGILWCWGEDEFGELGDGDDDSSDEPFVLVIDPALVQ